jgi:hypothetical protein
MHRVNREELEEENGEGKQKLNRLERGEIKKKKKQDGLEAFRWS